jgi:hypothetical protein
MLCNFDIFLNVSWVSSNAEDDGFGGYTVSGRCRCLIRTSYLLLVIYQGLYSTALLAKGGVFMVFSLPTSGWKW